MELEPGTEIGGYVVEVKAGSGAFGDVYRARRAHADQRPYAELVALKLISNATPEDEAFVADIVRRLHHPNIVETYDVFRHEGHLVLIQEWADGGTLEQQLITTTLSPTDVARLGSSLAGALDHAHAQGIVHRDVKPANVLIVDDRYTISDFGVSAVVEPDSGRTAAGQVAGTPLYWSPEQARGQPLSPASDIFSLGLLLYRVVYGRLPEEAGENLFALLRSRISRPIRVPLSRFRTIIRWCLALAPVDRPTARDLRYLFTRRRMTGPGDVAATEGPPGESMSTERSQRGLCHQPDSARRGERGGSRRRTRRRLVERFPRIMATNLAVAGGAAIVLVASVLVWAVIRGPGEPTRPATTTTTPDANEQTTTTTRPDSTTTTSTPDAPTTTSSLGQGSEADTPAGDGGGTDTWSWLPQVTLASVIVAMGMGLALLVYTRLARQMPQIERRAADVLFMAESRVDLTQSLMIEVDEVVRRLEAVDSRLLGVTLRAMVSEYDSAREANDRIAALTNVVDIMDKLRVHLSPWHVRHKEAIATSVAVVGCVSGIASVVAGFLG